MTENRVTRTPVRAAVLAVVAAALALSGCADLRRTILGEKQQGPDESQVVQVPPLAIPPDFELRPPTSASEADRAARDERALGAGVIEGRGGAADRFVEAKKRAGAYAPPGKVRADVLEERQARDGTVPLALGADVAEAPPPAGYDYGVSQEPPAPQAGTPLLPSSGYGLTPSSSYGAAPSAGYAPPAPAYEAPPAGPYGYGYGGGYGPATPSQGYATPSSAYGGYGPAPAATPSAPPYAYPAPSAYGTPAPAPVLQGLSAGENALLARAREAAAETGVGNQVQNCRTWGVDYEGRYVCAE